MEHMYRDLEASKQICRNGYQEPCGSTHEARQTGFEASISSFFIMYCQHQKYRFQSGRKTPFFRVEC